MTIFGRWDLSMHTIDRKLLQQLEKALVRELDRGTPQPIYVVLRDAQPDSLPGLCKALLPIELSHRFSAGEKISPQDYSELHSDAGEVVRSWMQQNAGASSGAEMDQALDDALVEGQRNVATLTFDGNATLPHVDAHGGSRPDLRVGDFVLRERIGKGGMGDVWRAEQFDPVERSVAVKLIRSSLAGAEQLMSRFEAERQAIALMDHPNIARLLDAGTTEDGSPYFAMELVRGQTLTRYVRTEHLSLRERLRIFVQVCRAVHHAHQKGIIHRDLKPANILVEEVNGLGHPKVIDFGLAKALSDRELLGEASLTQHGGILGTPLYMSPEQALGDPYDVDIRSDIFSLGCILFELLTGTTPIDFEEYRSSNLNDFLHRIREAKFEAPSARLSAMSDELSSRHAGGFENDSSTIQVDLDWITLKALEQERERRYRSASDFADDVERFLNHEPVQAAPPSKSYLIKKFVERNRLMVGAAASVLVALVLGLVGTAIGYVRAENSAIKERDAKELATQFQLQAEGREDDAIEAVQRFSRIILANRELSGSPELRQLRNDLLAEPLSFFVSLRGNLLKSEDPRPAAMLKLSEVAQGVALLSEDLGDRENALAAYRESAETLDALLKAQPDDPKARKLLATVKTNYGNLLRRMGKVREAHAELEEAIELKEERTQLQPGDVDAAFQLAGSYLNLASLQYQLDEIDSAIRSSEAAIRIQEDALKVGGNGQDRLDHCGCMMNYGTFLKIGGRPEEAATIYRKTIGLLQVEYETDNSDLQIVATYSNALVNLAQTNLDLGKVDDVEGLYVTALSVAKSAAQLNPTMIQLQSDYANLLSSTAVFYRQSGSIERALDLNRRAYEIQKRLAEENPGDTQLVVSYANTLGNLGNVFHQLGDVARSRTAYAKSIDIFDELVRANPDVGEFGIALATTYLNIAIVESVVGEWESARSCFRNSVTQAEKMLRENEQNARSRAFLIHCLQAFGKHADHVGDKLSVAAAGERLDELQ
ncbi:MAG: protein kinase domain-containing protein [Aureliella sp.]